MGGNESQDLADWLKTQSDTVIYRDSEINIADVKDVQPDFIISYNYGYIIKKEIIDYVDNNIINLHISYLPHNKGAHPNVWSFLEDSSKGVTIHYIDAGIDTGNIIVQKEVYINEEKETLKSSYNILQKAIQQLFKENWNLIKKGEITPQPQIGGGGTHFRKELNRFQAFIREKGWDTPIREFKEQFNKYST